MSMKLANYPQQIKSKKIGQIDKMEDLLGTPGRSIIDEFLEKFQTAFDPPPRAFFGKNVAIFCYKIFWNGNDPPKLASQMLKILQRNFLDRK